MAQWYRAMCKEGTKKWCNIWSGHKCIVQKVSKCMVQIWIGNKGIMQSIEQEQRYGAMCVEREHMQGPKPRREKGWCKVWTGNKNMVQNLEHPHLTRWQLGKYSQGKQFRYNRNAPPPIPFRAATGKMTWTTGYLPDCQLVPGYVHIG